eukprot:TRINITY_DN8178_c2_g3_i1.p1 TRINITY_DN8178_c2_g3~~TRINITY_DN8178_c2_g3_i1.p1  ORF type:complete len:128 (+),score=7.12 TRINITY_DN8178_c2_g3_i1:1021-1404(+)
MFTSTLSNFKQKFFLDWCQVNNFNTSRKGRILILWNPSEITVLVFFTSNQCIHSQIHNLKSNNTFFATVMYACNTVNQRISLWEDLSKIALTIKDPWIISGDFNYILSMEEKQQGRRRTSRDTQELL